MPRDPLEYYHDELSYLRKAGEEFARGHRTQGGALGLASRHDDPDPSVNRLIQAFALLTARIQSKLDAEFPAITEALLSVIYPHAVRPVPSAALVRLERATGGPAPPQPITIPAGALLRTQADSLGRVCSFQTTTSVDLWPLEIVGAALRGRSGLDEVPPQAAAALCLTLRAHTAGGFAELKQLQRLRFHIASEDPACYTLYQCLLGRMIGLDARGRDAGGHARATAWDGPAVDPIGFADGDMLFPDSALAPPGHLWLRELFVLPRKFLGFEVTGLDRLAAAGFGREVELRFFMNEAPPDDLRISADDFALGTTPILNVFPLNGRPIRLDHARSEYDVVPDAPGPPDHHEIYAIDAVESLDGGGEFAPFYGLRLDDAGAVATASASSKRSWYARRRQSPRRSNATQVSLVLDDQAFRRQMPRGGERIRVRLRATNHELPAQLPRDVAFHLDGHGSVRRVHRLTPLTAPVSPPLGEATLWSLIGRLGLGHLSLEDPHRGAAALRELLRLSAVTPRDLEHVRGLAGVSVERGIARLGAGTMVRGLDIGLAFDEGAYHPPGVAFLFGSVLDRFLAEGATLNTFTRVAVRLGDRELHRWPARLGTRTLI